jgi:hypothetical protein
VSQVLSFSNSGPLNSIPLRYRLAAVTVLSTFLTGFRSLFAVVLEVTASVLPAFFSGFRSFFTVFGKVAGIATMLSHNNILFVLEFNTGLNTPYFSESSPMRVLQDKY